MDMSQVLLDVAYIGRNLILVVWDVNDNIVIISI